MSAVGLATCLVLVAGTLGAARPALAWLQARRGTRTRSAVGSCANVDRPLASG